ncbi:DNA polymerase-1 [Jatrophihabitans sp. GAS493]|uniref:DNA polymerase n=1 Tax=Jatrophihabitans sp. GAS493 TaxID=1907575 RepID=UPI000BB76B54|nr:DNA polymerase [Jatrophihabitans sp. GAS493]SOD71684.1 DNA polymerase-1 [Jatrophihabitans sp. GAS493]
MISVAASELLPALQSAEIRRGDLIALSIAVGRGLGIAVTNADGKPQQWSVAADPLPGSSSVTGQPNLINLVAAIEAALRPRWVWWSIETPEALVRAGLRVATCWDVAAVHRLLFGGWQADPALVWATLRDLDLSAIPELGQLSLLAGVADQEADGGDRETPTRPDGYLRPEWAGGGWATTPARLAAWSACALQAAIQQRTRLENLHTGGDALATARSESAAELLCAELATDGLPVDRRRAEELIAAAAGNRPTDTAEELAIRARRDRGVLQHVRSGSEETDLRNPAQVRRMLAETGIDVPDTRSWRLQPFVGAHPVVEALLAWRKNERIATTYGYRWLDTNVGPDDRLRGAWSGCDGAAGRMTAQAGLHNLPAELRPAIAAEAGYVFVRADLGQIEPRVLAAVSGDSALIRASDEDDLYAPVAARLGVERPVAKVAILAAMYGQTSGVAGEALKGMESAYPVAMRYLRAASDAGKAGRPVRTYGGRLVRIGAPPTGLPEAQLRAALAARGRFARNAVVQGAAAEFFKAWAVTLRARAAPLGARIVLCLHDELLVHTPIEQGSAVADLLVSCLAETASRFKPDRPVRFVADVSIVNRWSEAKETAPKAAVDPPLNE